MNNQEGRKTYRRLNNELRRTTDKAREVLWSSQCEELELLDKKGRTDIIYAQIKKITEEKKAKSKICSIKNEGKLLTEAEEIRGRWKQYIEELYDKEGKPTEEELKIEDEEEVDKDCVGPEILEHEIEMAIIQMKDKKAEGVDGIPAKLLKGLGNKAMKELINLSKEKYEKRRMAKGLHQSNYI